MRTDAATSENDANIAGTSLPPLAICVSAGDDDKVDCSSLSRSPPSAGNKRSARLAFLIALAVALVLSRAVHVVAAQPFKSHLLPKELFVPAYHCLIEAFSFPVSIVFWVVIAYKKRGHCYVDNMSYRLPMYVGMSLIDAVNSYIAAIGLNVLPAAVYTVLKSSSTIFTILLSRYFTKKQFNMYHYLGATVLFFSPVFTSVSLDWSTKDGFDFKSFFGTAACLGSSFCMSLLGVCAYKFYKHENCKGDIVVAAEHNAFQATFMCLFLLPLLATEEARSWPAISVAVAENGQMTLLITCSLAMWICRPITEFSSIAITAYSSNVLVRALGGIRRVVVAVASLILFGQSIGFWRGIALVFMLVALTIYVYGGYLLQRTKRREAALECATITCKKTAA